MSPHTGYLTFLEVNVNKMGTVPIFRRRNNEKKQSLSFFIGMHPYLLVSFEQSGLVTESPEKVDLRPGVHEC